MGNGTAERKHRRVVVHKIGKRNCASCGKPMPLEHHLSKWHFSCKKVLPGYQAGYSDGRRSVTPKAPLPKEWPKLPPMERPKPPQYSLTNSQRQQIVREVLEKDKAKLERELAKKKVQLEFLEREKAAADCHARMLKAGFELPEFRFHPDVVEMHRGKETLNG